MELPILADPCVFYRFARPVSLADKREKRGPKVSRDLYARVSSTVSPSEYRVSLVENRHVDRSRSVATCIERRDGRSRQS